MYQGIKYRTVTRTLTQGTVVISQAHGTRAGGESRRKKPATEESGFHSRGGYPVVLTGPDAMGGQF